MHKALAFNRHAKGKNQTRGYMIPFTIGDFKKP